MLTLALALAAVAAAQPVLPGHLNRTTGTRNIAGCAANVQGRVWAPDSCCDCANPGAAYYGAADEGQIVYARIGQLTVGISPWEALNDESFPLLESARRQWLAEHGYTGGVRTFMNDAQEVADVRSEAAPEAEWKREIKPRWVIPVPEDMPRLRQRMEVDARGAREALERMGYVGRRVPVVIAPAVVAAK